MGGGHFEAKKHAYRQTQDGVVVSFVVHPNDVPADMAVAPLGTIYMIGFQSLGEDGAAHREAGGRPGPIVREHGRETPAQTDSGAGNAAPSPTKPKQKWSDLRPSAQVAMRCAEPDFRDFLAESRAHPYRVDSASDADDTVKEICGVTSKAILDPQNATHEPSALSRWRRIESDFRNWQLARGN